MVTPVEAFMGESCDSGRRIAWSGVFAIVYVSVQVSEKTVRGRNACLDSRSGRILNEFQLPECLLMIFEVSLIEALWG